MDRVVTIKRKADLRRKIEIDLTGPQGNAYALLGTADECKNWEIVVFEIEESEAKKLEVAELWK